MIQVRPFVISNAGTQKYWCLQNVRLGYSIPAYYSTAKKAWNGTIQHKNSSFPSGCAVPVFWSLYLTLDGVYADYGHVAVRLADGRYWTDGRYYNSLDSLNRYYLSGRGTYLGWGESVNNLRVVKPQEASMATMNDDVSRQVGFHYLGRNGQDGRPNALQSGQGDLIGKPLTNAEFSRIFLSAESRAWRDNALPKVYADRNTARASVAKLNSDIKQLNGVITSQEASMKALNTANDKLLATNEVLRATNTTLLKENTELRKQLEDCGETPEVPEDAVVITKDGLWTAFSNWVKSFGK